MTRSSDGPPAIVHVRYEGKPNDRFDRGYYVGTHLPLVLQSWEQYGLESVAAFFPAVDEPGTIAICECRFRNAEAVAAAFGSPEAPAVMADVAAFTDAAPSQSKAVAFPSEVKS